MRTDLRLVAALAVALAAPAAAELYRCEDPDGGAVFTDQKSACPGAEAYEPVGRLTSSSPDAPTADPAPADPTPSETAPSAPAPAARGQRDLETSAEEALERQWRQRKAEAEQAVQQIRDRREQLRRAVTHCNRGGWITARDDAGIKQRLNCSELKREFASLDDAEEEARDYLESGLADDCRRAGCLPGWIR